MRAFRLTRAKFAAFSGRGSLLASGRGHWIGDPMIYCADSRALAVLETLVHTRREQIPSDYAFYKVDVEDVSIERATTERLPGDWKAEEPSDARDFGSEWMRSHRSLALLVPSVVSPEEHNLLLNPGHPNFPRARIAGPQRFRLRPAIVWISYGLHKPRGAYCCTAGPPELPRLKRCYSHQTPDSETVWYFGNVENDA